MRRHPRLTTSSGIGSAGRAPAFDGRQHPVRHARQLHATQTRAYEAEGAEALQRKQAFETDHERALCLVNTTTEMERSHAGRPGRVRAGARALRHLESPTIGKTIATGNVCRPRTSTGWRRMCARCSCCWPGHASTWRRRPRMAVRCGLSIAPKAFADCVRPPALWEDRACYLKQRWRRGGKPCGACQGAGPFRPSAPAIITGAPPPRLQGRLWRSITELNQALRLNPRHYWSWLQRGICHLEVGEQALAAGDFNACVALWPDFAWSYFNRGHVLAQLGKKPEALADYGPPSSRDAGFVYAYLNRALVYLDSRQPGRGAGRT